MQMCIPGGGKKKKEKKKSTHKKQSFATSGMNSVQRSLQAAN